jgi:uncharacterized membrane protein
MAELFKEDKIKWFLLLLTFGIIAVMLHETSIYQSVYRTFFRTQFDIYTQFADVGFSIAISIILTFIVYLVATFIFNILSLLIKDSKEFIEVVHPKHDSLLDFIEFAPVDENGNVIFETKKVEK